MALHSPSSICWAIRFRKGLSRCGTVRFLPRFAAWAVAISPDGKTVAVGSIPGSCPDSCVELWDVATGQRTGTLAAGSQNILALAWAPDGRRLAVSHDERLEIFAAVEGKLLATLPQPKGALESLLAFRAMTGRSNAGMPRPKPARPVNWSIRWLASGERLAACSTNDRTEHREMRKIDQPQIPTRISFSPDGKLLAVGALNQGVRIYKDEALEEFGAIPDTAGCLLQPLAFVPNGKRIAVLVCKDRRPKEDPGLDLPVYQVRLWDYAERKTIWESAPLDLLVTLSASHDGRLVAAAVFEPRPAIWIWSAKSGKVLKVFYGHEEGATALDFSPDDTRLASAGADATVLIWDVSKLRE